MEPGLFLSSHKNQPSLILAALIVSALHLAMLGVGNFWDLTPPKPKERQKVVVQTITLQPTRTAPVEKRFSPPAPPPAAMPAPTQQIAATEVPKPPKVEKVIIEEPVVEKIQEKPIAQATPKPKPKPVPKPVAKEIKKAAPIKKPVEPIKKAVKQEAPKVKPNLEAEKKKNQEKAEAEKKRQQEIAAAEEVVRQKEQALLSKAKETLAKMGETRDKMSSTPTTSIASTAIPKEIGSLQVDALPFDTGTGSDWGSKEVSYSGEVASRLKKALKLPDYGAVKIKLTLDRTGKVIKVETLSSESAKNKTYAESKIPTLLFPPFGQRFKDADQNTFVITLQNDS